MIHVRHGKGANDCYVPLPERTLQLLRDYWRTHRHPVLLFPAEGREHVDLAQATEPMSKSSIQGRVQSGINMRAHASLHARVGFWQPANLCFLQCDSA